MQTLRGKTGRVPKKQIKPKDIISYLCVSSVVSNSLRSHELKPTRILCP